MDTDQTLPDNQEDVVAEYEPEIDEGPVNFVERNILLSEDKISMRSENGVTVFTVGEDYEPDSKPPQKPSSSKEPENDSGPALFFRVDQTPFWPTAILFGFQQLMVCISGVISSPLIISDLICAKYIPLVRVKLVGTMLFISGFSTILQSTFGTRLPLLQGPSFSFIPPIIAMMGLPDFRCTDVDAFMQPKFENGTENFDYNVTRGEELIAEIGDSEWLNRIQVIQGGLVTAAVIQMLIGFTGLIGLITQYLGPLTIAPLMLLLEISVIPTCLKYVTSHWMSAIVIILLLLTALYLNDLKVPLPSYSRKRKCEIKRQPIFAMFPYLIAIMTAWILCAVLTAAGALKEGSKARTDLRESVLTDAAWIRWPYPGQWGPISINVGVFLGFVAATVASVIESVGDYHACARVCHEKPPPSHAVNRGILMEGFCCFIGGFIGSGLSVTTYSENVGVIGLTKVASRRVFQISGVIMIVLGVLTKVGAVFATIPDPIVGGILTVSLAMVGGVGLSSIHLLDLKLSRNIAILGFSIMVGLQIPKYISENPIKTGYQDLDQVLNILFTIDMFVGGLVGFLLDNTVPGATRAQRGLQPFQNSEKESDTPDTDVYSFPKYITKLLNRIPGTSYMPFLPTFSASPFRKRVRPRT